MLRFVVVAAVMPMLAAGCDLFDDVDTPAAPILRVADDQSLVVRHWTAAGIAADEVDCAHPRCLRARPDVVAIARVDGTTLVRREVDGVLVDVSLGAVAPADEPEPLAWARAESDSARRSSPQARAEQLENAEPSSPSASSSSSSSSKPSKHWEPPPSAPTLPAGERTCGTTRAGGGFGYHVVADDGDVWRRVAWVTPPTAPEVLALAADAYPIASRAGLCAWAEQRRGPRQWTVHHATTSTTVVARADAEHPPARCMGAGVVVVETQLDRVEIGVDGGTRVVGPGERVAAIDTRRGLAMRAGAVTVRRGPGQRAVDVVFAADRRLDGTAIEPGFVRNRVLTAGDGVDRFAVAERFVGAGGRGLEALYVLRIDDDGARITDTLVVGDRVVSRLEFSIGGLWWIEASPRTLRLTD